MRLTVQTALALALSLVAASSIVTAQESVDRQAEEQKIRDLDRQWVQAVAAGDVEAIANFYAPEGRFMPPNAPAAEGRDAVATSWRGILGLPEVKLTFGPTQIEVAQAGDMAYDVGTYSLSFKGAQGPVQDGGKYVVVWQKVDGEWRAVADILNSDLAAP